MDQIKKYSIQQMASVIRERTKQGVDMTDEHLVQEWVKQYPGDKQHLDDAGRGYMEAIALAQSIKPQPAEPFKNSAGEVVPKPLPLVGEAARIGTTNASLLRSQLVDPIKKVFDPLLPELSPETKQKIDMLAPVKQGMVPFMPTPSPSTVYEGARQLSSPFDLATLGALGTARSAAMKLPKLAKAAVGVDRAASAGLAGLGTADVVDAFSDTSKPLDQRITQGAVGTLMGTLGAYGFRNPIQLPQAAIPTPVAPQQLALPPIGGTTPTQTRFYAGEAGIADVTQQYPAHLFGPTNPLLTESGITQEGMKIYGTPTAREAGQIYNIPPIEAARGPQLSGLHGTGAPAQFDEAAAMADFARQVRAAQEAAAAKQRKLLPAKTSGPTIPPSGTVQTGTGGQVNFGAAEGMLPKPKQTVIESDVSYIVKHSDGTTSYFETLDDAVDYAANTGAELGQVNAQGKVTWLDTEGIEDAAGFARPELLRPLAGGLAGGLTGAAVGDTTEEKIKLGLAGATIGAIAGRPRRLAKLDLPTPGKKPIPVSHGSPHNWAAERLIVGADGVQKYIVGAPGQLPDVPQGATVLKDFPLGRPRMDKIGTGEGATAYSRGLYAAQGHGSPVAKQYAKNLGRVQVFYDGKVIFPSDKSPLGTVALYLSNADGNTMKALDELRLAAQNERRGLDAETIEAMQEMGLGAQIHRRRQRYVKAFDLLRNEREKFDIKGSGGVYNLELKANENHMIHWDKPFEQQPEYVRKKLKNFDLSAENRTYNLGGFKTETAPITGADIYSAVRTAFKTEKEAVEWLRKQGIKGVKYLDGNSRGAGEGTYNYVAFDENILEVLGKETGSASPELLKKMGGAAIGGLGGAALGDTPEERIKLGTLGAVTGGLLPRGKQQMPKGSPYIKDKPAKLIEAQAKEGTKGESSILPFTTKFKRNLVSRFAPNDYLDDIVEQNAGRKLKPSERSGETNRAVLGGQSGRTRAAMYDLEDIRKVAKEGGYDEEVRNILNMNAILHGHKTLLKRAAKLSGAERENLLRRINTGEVFPMRITKKEAEAALREAQKSPNFAKAQEAANQIFKFNRESLDMIYKEGLITKEGYEELVSRGEDYVPLFRRSEGGLIDEADLQDLTANIEREMSDRWRSAGLTVKKLNAIRKLEGSERITQDPLQASLYLRQLAEREVGRNEAARTLFNLRNIEGAQMDDIIVPLTIYGKDGKIIGKKSAPVGMKEVNFRKDGEIFSFAVPREIAQAQLMIDGKSLVAGMSALGEFLGKGKTIQQAAATGVNIPFAISNILRDFRTARRFLKTNKMTPASWAESWNEWRKALASRLAKDEKFREALRSRAMHGTLQEQLLPTDLVLGGRKMGIGKRIIHNIGEFNRILEETGKSASYNLLRKRGVDLDAAVSEARKMGGSPDFADMGTKISEGFNLMFMFLNPAIQGIAQNVRGISRNPGKAAVQFGMAIGASIGLYNWNSQFRDEDGNPEMVHVPKHDRDTSFIFIMPWKDEKSGRNFYFKIPKSHADRLFYNATQDAIDMAAGDEHMNTAQIGLDVASQFLPGGVGLKADNIGGTVARNIGAMANPAFRMPAEIISKQKFFEGVPIESKRLESLSPENRYDSTTGATYRKIAGAMPDFLPEQFRSPKMWQHGVESLFSAPGRDVMRALDYMQKPTSIKLEGFDTTKRVPVVGGLAGRLVGGGTDYKLSQDIEEIYKQLEKSKQAMADYRAGRGQDEANIMLQKPLDSITRELAQLRKLREAIMSGEQQTSDPKAELRDIRNKERELVKDAKQLTKGAK